MWASMPLKKLFPQLMAVTVLACIPLAGGVTVANTLDESVKSVDSSDHATAEPPGVGLGTELRWETCSSPRCA